MTEKKKTPENDIKKETKETCRQLALRLYELDGEVYRCVGSNLGRTFTGDKEHCIDSLTEIMCTKPQGHLLRSEMALISNMAHTIPDKEDRDRLMAEYNAIHQEISQLPECFGSIDILDEKRAKLNTSNLGQKFSKDDHLIICISRTHGSAGNDIGFALADALKINYYDAEIFQQVLKRLEAEKDSVEDGGSLELDDMDKYAKRKRFSLKRWWKDVNRYHGLPTKDAIFFNQSDLICQMAKKEDFIVMGRCADVVLRNHHIPHISIFISAPFEQRLHHIMSARDMSMKQAVHFLTEMDKQHRRYYNYYTGGHWGHAENYDLCINSASYGIQETVELIERMIHQEPR